MQSFLTKGQLEVVRVARRGQGVVQRHGLCAIELEQSLVEGLHSVEPGLRDDVLDHMRVLGVDDEVAYASVHDEHLDRRHQPIGVGTWDQPLGDDSAERRTDLRLLARLEEVDDAVHRLGDVARVESGDHEVSGLGGLQRRGHGLGVADLTEEDDVGVLTHRRSQRQKEVRRVLTDLALVDDRGPVLMQDLDGVLDSQDVAATGRVDVVDHCGGGGRLARRGRPGYEQEAAHLIGQRANHGGKTEAFEAGASREHAAGGEGDRATLEKDVEAEAPKTGEREREVDLTLGLEDPRLVVVHDLEGGSFAVRRRHGRKVGCVQNAVDADVRGTTGLHVKVRSLAVHHVAHEVVNGRHM